MRFELVTDSLRVRHATLLLVWSTNCDFNSLWFEYHFTKKQDQDNCLTPNKCNCWHTQMVKWSTLVKQT